MEYVQLGKSSRAAWDFSVSWNIICLIYLPFISQAPYCRKSAAGKMLRSCIPTKAWSRIKKDWHAKSEVEAELQTLETIVPSAHKPESEMRFFLLPSKFQIVP